MASAIFHNAFQVMGLAHDPYRGIRWEGAVGEHLGEPLANLLQIAQHRLSSPAIGAGNEHKLRTQMTAD